jgi:phosphoribosyl-AMP cyclohydrolase
MLRTKLVSYNAITTPKPLTTNNVPINLVVAITLVVNSRNNKCSRRRSRLKLKGMKNGNKKNVYEFFLVAVTLVVNSQNNKCSRRRSRLKLKGMKNGNKKNVYEIFSLKLLDSYNIMGMKNNLLLSMKVHCRIIGLDYLIIQPQLN